METSFAKYVDILIGMSKKLLEYPYSPKIRKIAIKSVTACLNAVSTTEDKKKF